MKTQSTATASLADRLAQILRIHFDPVHGSPYWIELAAQRRLHPTDTIRSIADLHQLGFMDQAALRTRPLTDFIPCCISQHPERLIVVQTGGTLGDPIWTAYTHDEYEAAFVRPFVDAAQRVAFPRGGTWLYVGPSGPHVIGRAASSIARALGASEPFTVDFDSRWARKLPTDSYAAERYLEHVTDQAMAVIKTQQITHLFTTPPVLAALADRMTGKQRDRIVGVHYGGMSISHERMLHFQRDIYPHATHLSGYGNTLFGCCLELSVTEDRDLRYFPHGRRLLFGVMPEPTEDAALVRFDPGARGRCVFSRFDRTMLIINFVERDEIELVSPPAVADFVSPGILNPHPLTSDSSQSSAGIY